MISGIIVTFEVHVKWCILFCSGLELLSACIVFVVQ